jgi:hypothetical protein
MKIIDIPDSKIIKSNPDQKIILLSNGDVIQNGFKIIKLELRLYFNTITQKPARNSIITAYLETENHSIEAIYDEGNLGIDELEKSVKLLTNNLGLSGLILRLIISLENILASKN